MTRKSPHNNFRTAMSTIQSTMPLAQKVYSKLLHMALIEHISTAIAHTLLRPRAVIGAGLGAIVVLMAAYALTVPTGYHLTGSEGLIGATCGWLGGLLTDIVLMIRHRKQ